jgi:hypothetical protein
VEGIGMRAMFSLELEPWLLVQNLSEGASGHYSLDAADRRGNS